MPGAGRYHPRRRRAVWEELSFGEGELLSCRSGALEFVAEVLKVFLADLQLEHFFDDRQEVRQRTNDSERRNIGGPGQPARRGPNKGGLDHPDRDATVWRLGRVQA